MLPPCGSSRYRSCTSGYVAADIAVTSSSPSSASSLSDWMSSITGSNSWPRTSTVPDASPQNMNASSGSALKPTRISIGVRLDAYHATVSQEPLTESIQHYLREIYKLAQGGEPVGVTALARAQEVSAASASAMVKKLTALGLAEHPPYRGISLTPSGERVAIEVIRHHRLLELYLAETLGVDVEDVHAEADKLEHVISEELEARIDRALGFPTHDPHGDPIPDANLRWPADRAETS